MPVDENVALDSKTQGGAGPFAGLLLAGSGKPATGVVLLHGRVGGPDGPVVGWLRKTLNAAGYTTISLENPTPTTGGEFADYVADVTGPNKLFPEAGARIKTGIAELKKRGCQSVVVGGFSMGSRMTSAFLASDGKGALPIKGFVAVGIGVNGKGPLDATTTLGKVKVPAIDVCGAGEPHPLGSRRGLEQFPQVMVLENRKGKLGPRNDLWHSDISYGEIPPLGSALYAIEVTQGRADTMFNNMYAAYEKLSPGLRATLDTLQAVHTAEPLVREVPSRLSVKEAPPGVVHPVVRTHPETGRKALYVSPWFTSHFVGWTVDESQALLEYLIAEATQHENIYRHHWRVGDFLMWDNRCAMHYGVRDYDDTMPRFLWRVTAAGDRPR